MDGAKTRTRIIAGMSIRTHQSPMPRARRTVLPLDRTRARVRPPARTPGGRLQARILAVGAVGVLLLLLVHEVSGLSRLQSNPVIGSDYVETARYVAARHKPGEPIFVAIPTQAYLALGNRDDLVFVSSPLDRERAQRYSRLTSDGRYVDYWTGVRSIVSTGQLCQALLTSPDLWMLVDGARLNADWAYLGDMATVINGLTYIRYYDMSGAMVRRLAPVPSRDSVAEKLCTKAMELEGLTLGS